MVLLWWKDTGKPTKENAQDTLLKKQKKVASRSDERSNEWHEWKAVYIPTKYYIYSKKHAGRAFEETKKVASRSMHYTW
jgi:hypothetical protein